VPIGHSDPPIPQARPSGLPTPLPAALAGVVTDHLTHLESLLDSILATYCTTATSWPNNAHTHSTQELSSKLDTTLHIASLYAGQATQFPILPLLLTNLYNNSTRLSRMAADLVLTENAYAEFLVPMSQK